MKLEKGTPAEKVWAPIPTGGKFGAPIHLNEEGDNTTCIAWVFGETPEQANKRRDTIVNAVNRYTGHPTRRKVRI